MQVNRAICDRFCEAYKADNNGDDCPGFVSKALDAAFAPYEMAPFELNRAEQAAHERARLDLVQSPQLNAALTAALDRAQRTLVLKQAEQPRGEWTDEDYAAAGTALASARSRSYSNGIREALDAVKHRLDPDTQTEPRAVDKLTPQQRTFVESTRPLVDSAELGPPEWLRIIDQLAPKPAPAKSLGEVLYDHFCPAIRCTPSDLAHYEKAALAVIAAHEASK